MSARQNKKRKGRNILNNRERTVTTLTEDPNTSFLVPTPSEEPPQIMSSPPHSAPAYNMPASFSFQYPYMQPLHQHQQHPFYNHPHSAQPQLPPGKNDLEVLENLKQIIKNGQHEFYRAVPQPALLAGLYLGPRVIPHPEQIPQDTSHEQDTPDRADPQAIQAQTVSVNETTASVPESKSVGSAPDDQRTQPDKSTRAQDVPNGDLQRPPPGEYPARTHSPLREPSPPKSYDARDREEPPRDRPPTPDDRRARYDDRLAPSHRILNGTSSADTRSNGDARFPPSRDRGFYERDRERDVFRDRDLRERDQRERDLRERDIRDRDIRDRDPRDIRDRDREPREWDRERDRERDIRDRRLEPPRSYGRSFAPRPPPEQRHYEPRYDVPPPRRYDRPPQSPPEDVDMDKRPLPPRGVDDRPPPAPPAQRDEREETRLRRSSLDDNARSRVLSISDGHAAGPPVVEDRGRAPPASLSSGSVSVSAPANSVNAASSSTSARPAATSARQPDDHHVLRGPDLAPRDDRLGTTSRLPQSREDHINQQPQPLPTFLPQDRLTHPPGTGSTGRPPPGVADDRTGRLGSASDAPPTNNAGAAVGMVGTDRPGRPAPHPPDSHPRDRGRQAAGERYTRPDTAALPINPPPSASTHSNLDLLAANAAMATQVPLSGSGTASAVSSVQGQGPPPAPIQAEGQSQTMGQGPVPTARSESTTRNDVRLGKPSAAPAPSAQDIGYRSRDRDIDRDRAGAFRSTSSSEMVTPNFIPLSASDPDRGGGPGALPSFGDERRAPLDAMDVDPPPGSRSASARFAGSGSGSASVTEVRSVPAAPVGSHRRASPIPGPGAAVGAGDARPRGYYPPPLSPPLLPSSSSLALHSSPRERDREQERGERERVIDRERERERHPYDIDDRRYPPPPPPLERRDWVVDRRRERDREWGIDDDWHARRGWERERFDRERERERERDRERDRELPPIRNGPASALAPAPAPAWDPRDIRDDRDRRAPFPASPSTRSYDGSRPLSSRLDYQTPAPPPGPPANDRVYPAPRELERARFPPPPPVHGHTHGLQPLPGSPPPYGHIRARSPFPPLRAQPPPLPPGRLDDRPPLKRSRDDPPYGGPGYYSPERRGSIEGRGVDYPPPLPPPHAHALPPRSLVSSPPPPPPPGGGGFYDRRSGGGVTSTFTNTPPMDRDYGRIRERERGDAGYPSSSYDRDLRGRSPPPPPVRGPPPPQGTYARSYVRDERRYMPLPGTRTG